MEPWKTIARHTLIEKRPFLIVENHVVELHDGRLILDWPWIITPDYVNVAAITREDTFLCFRQTKYGVDGISLAPVGGYMEPGETALAAAQRELLEETGYEAPEWVDLGRYRVDANRGVGTGYFWLARRAYQVTKPQPDDLEEQVPLQLSRAEVELAMGKGEYKVMAWAAVMAMALLYLNNESKQ